MVRLPHEQFKIIFDVGANVGKSAAEFSIEYPEAQIFAFEPDPETFQKLRAHCSKDARIHTFNLAIGRLPGTVRFDNSRKSTVRQVAKDQSVSTFPTVEVDNIDTFCSKHAVETIDFLKIDTEGHDLQVLQGANEMLRSASVSVFVAECSPNRDNTWHAPFGEIHRLAEDRDYRLFGIYEQQPEWPSRKPHLRRFNAAYISPRVIRAARGDP